VVEVAADDILRASDLMADYIYVKPDDSIQNTLKLIFSENISSVLVLDKGKLKGVATLRDFATKIPWGKKPLRDVKVKDVMTRRVVFVRPEDCVAKVLDFVYHIDIRVVPVVSQQEVYGIITRAELVELFAKTVGRRYKVGDLMTFRYSKATIHDPMEKVVRKILSYGYKYIVVVRGSKVVGVITLSDILKEFYLNKAWNCDLPITELMTPNPMTSKKGDMCDIAARKIIRNRISALPVLNGKRELEGLINLKCFFKVLEV